MRPGGEYFTEPEEPTQRRYEALRAYFIEGLTASEVAARFGYSPQVVHQMASELRAIRAAYQGIDTGWADFGQELFASASHPAVWVKG